MQSLLLSEPHRVATSDDSGTGIIKTVIPKTNPVPYLPLASACATPQDLPALPSLQYFCIRGLLKDPLRPFYTGNPRILWLQDVINELYGKVCPDAADYKRGHPCLWMVLSQVYRGIPEEFNIYVLPLADPHVVMFQSIEPSPQFALVTFLDLSSTPALTDDSIVKLKVLSQLVAFDASNTPLTSRGVKRFADTLQQDAEDGRCWGPWKLRVWDLRGSFVDNVAGSALGTFPLLCVVDVRKTGCNTDFRIHGWPLLDPGAERDQGLFHPTPLDGILTRLLSISTALLPTQERPSVLEITELDHPKPKFEKLPFMARLMLPKPFPTEDGVLHLPPGRSIELLHVQTALHRTSTDQSQGFHTMPLRPRTLAAGPTLKQRQKHNEQPSPVLHADSPFLLSRYPPPYSDLDHVYRKHRRREETAILKPRKDSAMASQLAKAALISRVARQRRLDGEPGAAPEPSTRQGFNPFRKGLQAGGTSKMRVTLPYPDNVPHGGRLKQTMRPTAIPTVVANGTPLGQWLSSDPPKAKRSQHQDDAHQTTAKRRRVSGID